MALTSARTMPGVMELLPLDQIAFQDMLDTIRRNFERFGFLPIETPVMEFSDVLLTKSGGETERQVYFVQSTGALNAAEKGSQPELALRFDLTVPLARYVAEHENELNFPFRRYQIQRVYRGERAQRGRLVDRAASRMRVRAVPTALYVPARSQPDRARLAAGQGAATAHPRCHRWSPFAGGARHRAAREPLHARPHQAGGPVHPGGAAAGETEDAPRLAREAAQRFLGCA